MNRAGDKPVRPHGVHTDPHGDYVDYIDKEKGPDVQPTDRQWPGS